MAKILVNATATSVSFFLYSGTGSTLLWSDTLATNIPTTAGQATGCGSVAYKLAQVAVGIADGTWTLVPKHEWDIAGGAALVKAAGGSVLLADGTVVLDGTAVCYTMPI